MRYFLIAAILFITYNTQAQVERGRLTFNAGFSGWLSQSTTDYVYSESTTKTKQLGLSPGFGLFVIDGLEVGFSPGITFGRSENNYESEFQDSRSESQFTTQSIGLYSRYYLGKGASGKPFISLAANRNWNSSWQNYTYTVDNQPDESRSEVDSKQLDLRLTIGYGLFLNDSFILNFFSTLTNTFGHQNSIDVAFGNSASDSHSFQLTIGASISSTFKRKSK